jgi:ABC-type lipoprotein release transport system permease subunit
MVGPRLVAVWMRARSTMRDRWAAWLGLTLLVGLAGGFVISAAAGARRTAGAYERLLASTAPFDVAIGCASPEEAESCGEETRPALRAALARPEVATSTILTTGHFAITTAAGESLQPEGEICYGGPGEVNVAGSADNRFGTSINRFEYVAGGAPDPTRAGEATLSAATARRVGVDVGDRLLVTAVDACGDVPEPQWPRPVRVTVVGLTVAAGEVQPVDGMYLQTVTVTPPQLARLAAHGPIDILGLVRLREGTDVAEYVRALEDAGSPLGPVIVQRELTASVADSLRPDATTLALLALLGGTGMLVVVGQMFTRQCWTEAGTLPVLRALGFTRHDLTAVGAVKGALVGTGGAVVAVAVAIVASPLAPIGRARRIEPAPGVHIDTTTFVLGAFVIVVAVTMLVTTASWFVAGRSRPSRRARRRASVTAPVTERVAVTPTMRAGAGIAVDRGRDERAAPLRTGVLGAAIGLAAVFGALAFDAGLDHLFATDRLVGINWDAGFLELELPDPNVPPDFDALLADVRRTEGVERAGFASFWPPFGAPVVDDRFATWPMAFSTEPGAVGPSVVEGHAPRRADEVLLARDLLRQLDRRIGDDLVLHGETMRDDGSAPVATSGRFRIVGTGVVPAPNSLDLGVALTMDGLRRLDPRAAPNALFVDYTPGSDRAAVQARIEALGFGAGPGALKRRGVDFVGLDLRQADRVPLLFGALMAVLAAGLLVHLVASATRAHRRDLATLRALGFTRPQVRATLVWSAATITAATLVVAALLGTAVGFAVWERYATRLDVVVEGAVPWSAVAAVAGVVVVFTAAVAVASGTAVLRRPAADGLRQE